jgi:hypothetical protein
MILCGLLVAATDIVFWYISRKNEVKIFLVAATKKFPEPLYLDTILWYNGIKAKT